jgi:hypothetical protein
VRRYFHEVSNPCAALGRKHEEAGVKGSMAATAHGKRIGEIVGNQTAGRVLTVVVALHVAPENILLSAMWTDVGSVQTATLSSKDADPIASNYRIRYG